MLVLVTIFPVKKIKSIPEVRIKLGIKTEKNWPNIIDLGTTGWTKYMSIILDLTIFLYVMPADLSVKREKYTKRMVPYPSLEPSGKSWGFWITKFINLIQAKEKIIPKIEIMNVEAKRFFKDWKELLNEVRNSASNIA